MKKILYGKDDIVGPWVSDILQQQWYPHRATTIGLAGAEVWPTGGVKWRLLAGVLYADFNGANIVCHIAAVPGRRWMTREYLRAIFTYPFVQLKAKRITVTVAHTNRDSRRFCEHLGFELEGVMRDAAPEGDLILYRMMAADCRWLGNPTKAIATAKERRDAWLDSPATRPT